jgi:predicted DNA-binding protein YlxM (UPF0122 family)
MIPILNTKSRSEWKQLISEWVHSERDRKMLERYLLDDISLEQLGEEFDLSTVQCQKRMAEARKQLFQHI